jgi:acetolactate synthase-1/2/3 large subunit
VKVTGAQLMAWTLKEAGIEVVAGIPGHTVTSLANRVAQQEGLKPLLVRHEAIGTFASDIYFRVSGRLMATFTHTFPGATNALPGVANAYADSSAMLLIVGETAGPALGRGAYQELSRQFDGDTAQLIRHAVKRVWQPREALDLVDKTFLAVRTALSGRPGPVALVVSQEIWDAEVEIPDWPSARGYLFADRTRPAPDVVERVAKLVHDARRPLLLAGNGVNLGRARKQLKAFAERSGLPVATTVTGKGSFPDAHPQSLGTIGWVGTAAANWAAQNADLVIALGARLTETTSSSWQPGVTFNFPEARLVQVDVDPTAIANFYPVDEAVVGDVGLFLDDLTAALGSGLLATDAAWRGELDSRRAAWADVVKASQTPGRKGLIGVGWIVAALQDAYADTNVNFVCDVGKHHKWVSQQFDAREEDYVINSVAAGVMGVGPMGAIGAALARPEVPTIAWTGDGGMSMALHAWPTVAEHQLPIKYVVVDDGAYGAVANIEMNQFGRTVFSEFNAGGANPGYRLDLGAVAQAIGIPSRRVEDPSEVREAIAWARSVDGPTVLDVCVDRTSVAPDGGGKYLHALWDHRPLPWAQPAPAKV